MGADKFTENDPETGEWREGTMSKVWQIKKEAEITTAVITTILLVNAQMCKQQLKERQYVYKDSKVLLQYLFIAKRDTVTSE